jgi:hypothetical protein
VPSSEKEIWSRFMNVAAKKIVLLFELHMLRDAAKLDLVVVFAEYAG